MAATVEKHPSKDELPVAPEELRDAVKKPVKLRHTEVVEKIVLPTEDGKCPNFRGGLECFVKNVCLFADIKFEKHQQCNSPILNDVASFNRQSLRQTETDEKTGLPSQEGKHAFFWVCSNVCQWLCAHDSVSRVFLWFSEYKQIKSEKEAFRSEISHFEKEKLKHVTPTEKHDVQVKSKRWGGANAFGWVPMAGGGMGQVRNLGRVCVDR